MRGASLAAVLAAAAALGGCGAASADLFEVRRSGDDAAANLRLVVNDGGTVTCDGGEPRALQGDQLLEARELARELEAQSALLIDLPPGPGAVLRYEVRTATGQVAFSDTSLGRPEPFDELTAFTKTVAEDVCGVER